MSGLSTHVLDTARGRPAAGVEVTLAILGPGGALTELFHAETDADGRVKSLLPEGGRLEAASYRLTFGTGRYFLEQGLAAFYPEVTIAFTVASPGEHHHVPLLLSPFGYSTYRGS
jgi:5-hydroxyisourate hydrolase